MLDWDDLRFFLAIARHRSLSAAAKDLRVTQSTVGRRLASFQIAMGVRLLQRTADGYVLTIAGEAILANAERVEGEALSVERTISGHDVRNAGLVRVTSSQLVTSHLLAPCFAELHTTHRGLLIESLPLLPDEPLATQDADVAVKLTRFAHHELVVRSIGSVAFGLYGCKDYLARRGTPEIEDGCAGHQLITLLDDRELSEQAAWFSDHGQRGQVVLRADSYETQYWATTCGGGLAVLPRFRADSEAALVRVATAIPIPCAEIWLGVHRENRDVPSVRAVLDKIAKVVRKRSAILDPQEVTLIAAPAKT